MGGCQGRITSSSCPFSCVDADFNDAHCGCARKGFAQDIFAMHEEQAEGFLKNIFAAAHHVNIKPLITGSRKDCSIQTSQVKPLRNMQKGIQSLMERSVAKVKHRL